MAKETMKQSGTQYGQRGETGEKLPKGVTSSDKSGEKSVKVHGGVGIGKADSIGARDKSHLGKHDGHQGEFNDGKSGERVVYEHKRTAHDQDY